MYHVNSFLYGSLTQPWSLPGKLMLFQNTLWFVKWIYSLCPANYITPFLSNAGYLRVATTSYTESSPTLLCCPNHSHQQGFADNPEAHSFKKKSKWTLKKYVFSWLQWVLVVVCCGMWDLLLQWEGSSLQGTGFSLYVECGASCPTACAISAP